MDCPHFTPSERWSTHGCVQNVSLNSESYQCTCVILIQRYPDENSIILVSTVALTVLLTVLCIIP